ncbi:transposase, partial [Escherichia coli]
MRKDRFTEHHIITVIKSVEAGRSVKDVCREAEPPTTSMDYLRYASTESGF